jgi:hypothetical protein
MSQQKEERARQKFSEKMRQKSLTASKAKLATKDGPKATPIDAGSDKKD